MDIWYIHIYIYRYVSTVYRYTFAAYICNVHLQLSVSNRIVPTEMEIDEKDLDPLIGGPLSDNQTWSWKIPCERRFKAEIIYKWWIFNSHFGWPEGTNTFILSDIYRHMEERLSSKLCSSKISLTGIWLQTSMQRQHWCVEIKAQDGRMSRGKFESYSSAWAYLEKCYGSKRRDFFECCFLRLDPISSTAKWCHLSIGWIHSDCWCSFWLTDCIPMSRA